MVSISIAAFGVVAAPPSTLHANATSPAITANTAKKYFIV
jgi:hypothetical protein